MLGVLDGTSLLEMATKWDVTQSAVTKWLAAYVERGLDGLTPTKPAGPPSRFPAQSSPRRCAGSTFPCMSIDRARNPKVPLTDESP